MGGGAIKKDDSSICCRLPHPGYVAVKSLVLTTLAPHVTACEAVRELPGKEDFGDLDVLYCLEASTAVPDILKQHFGVVDCTHIVRKGPVTSFAFNVKDFLKTHCPEVPTPATDYFQVDLIRVADPASIVMSRFHSGYGDVGEILGRYFSYYGLKFGDAGLWCEVSSSTVERYRSQDSVFVPLPAPVTPSVPVAGGGGAPNSGQALSEQQPTDGKKREEVVETLGRIQLTADPAEICGYAGLNYGRWCQGFDQVDDVVAWLVDCDFFMPTIFDHQSYEQNRASKRPFYKKFLDHINMTPGKAGAAQVRKNKQLESIAHFKQEDRFLEIIRGTEIAKERRAKFNGKLLAAAIEEAMPEQAKTDGAPGDVDKQSEPIKPLDGKAIAQAVSDFKIAVLTKFSGNLPLGTDVSAFSKMEVESKFTTMLDDMSVEAIRMEMALFASTYTPPSKPNPAAEKKKKAKTAVSKD